MYNSTWKKNKIELDILNEKGNLITGAYVYIVGDHLENKQGKPLLCSCTGKTEKTASPVLYKDGEVKCSNPNCKRTFKIVYTYEDEMKKIAEYEARKKDEFKVELADEDWETGIKYYMLSSRVDSDVWKKIAKYFTYYHKGEIEDTASGYPLTGWATRQPEEVEKILVNEGLIQTKNTLKAQEEQKQEAKKHDTELETKRDELKNRIDEAFKNAEYPTEEKQIQIDGKDYEDPTTPKNIYGGGSWYTVTEKYIYFVQNNGADGDDWGRNNIATAGAGAIGIRIQYNKEIEDLIKEYVVMK
jgi:hypothetical protein